MYKTLNTSHPSRLVWIRCGNQGPNISKLHLNHLTFSTVWRLSQVCAGVSHTCKCFAGLLVFENWPMSNIHHIVETCINIAKVIVPQALRLQIDLTPESTFLHFDNPSFKCSSLYKMTAFINLPSEQHPNLPLWTWPITYDICNPFAALSLHIIFRSFSTGLFTEPFPASLLLVAMPFAPSSVLAPSSKAKSP